MGKIHEVYSLRRYIKEKWIVDGKDRQKGVIGLVK